MASIADRPRTRSAQKPLRRQLRGPRLTPEALQQRLRTSRRQQAQRARAARRRIDRDHHRLPAPVHAVFEPLAPALTRPTYHRLVLLALAAILTVGGRTVANLLRLLGALAPGHASSYHRLLSHRRWPARRLARRYIAAVLARFAPRGPVALAGDDTVTEHPGAKVYGKGCHRDPVRSTKSFTAYRWGHKWVVLTSPTKLNRRSHGSGKANGIIDEHGRSSAFAGASCDRYHASCLFGRDCHTGLLSVTSR